MDPILAQIILAAIQGLTEAFPVSSSGHLVLAAELMGYDLDLLFSVAVHFGTLMAIFVYFGKDIVNILRDMVNARFKTEHGKLGLYLIIATIPAAVAGLLLNNFVESAFDNLLLLALGWGITSMILFTSSLNIPAQKSPLTLKKALIIGIAQIAALFRGISRSGSTIGTGLLLGLDEKTAVKFSFLMSIPIVFGANILEVGGNSLSPDLFIPAFISFIICLGAIHVSVKYVLNNRKNLRYFAIYTLLLAIGAGIYALAQ